MQRTQTPILQVVKHICPLSWHHQKDEQVDMLNTGYKVDNITKTFVSKKLELHFYKK